MPPTPEEDREAVMRASTQLAERLAPQLNECGVEAFVMFAYVSGADGRIRRVTIGSHGAGDNPAYKDALSGVERMATLWSAGAL